MKRRRRRKAAVKATGTCKATGKKRFRTEDDAETVIANAQYESRILHNQNRRESRSYDCRQCGGWHVTSQPKNEDIWLKRPA